LFNNSINCLCLQKEDKMDYKKELERLCKESEHPITYEEFTLSRGKHLNIRIKHEGLNTLFASSTFVEDDSNTEDEWNKLRMGVYLSFTKLGVENALASLQERIEFTHNSLQMSKNMKTVNKMEEEEETKAGLLGIEDEVDSFVVSTVVGAVTDSAILGSLLGGSLLGGILGDVLDGDLWD
jgi:hypothetical protein